MLVTGFLCRWQKWPKLSPTSYYKHKHVSSRKSATKVTPMLVTDVWDQLCWWQVWHADNRFNTLRKSPTYKKSRHHKVTNIPMLPTSLSPSQIFMAPKFWNFGHVIISSTWKLGGFRTHHHVWNPNWHPFDMIFKHRRIEKLIQTDLRSYFWNQILEKHNRSSKTSGRFYWRKAITTACWQTEEWNW